MTRTEWLARTWFGLLLKNASLELAGATWEAVAHGLAILGLAQTQAIWEVIADDQAVLGLAQDLSPSATTLLKTSWLG